MLMKCPLCDTPYAATDRQGICDHEAGWYRRWLAVATAALDEIATYSTSPDSAEVAESALRKIRDSAS